MQIKSHVRRYAEDVSGQFAVMFALIMFALIVLIAATFNMITLHNTKSKLYDIADSAVLAGAVASEMKSTERVKIVEDFIKSNSSPELYSQISGRPLIRFDDVNREVTVKIKTSFPTLLSSFLGQKSASVSAMSVAVYAEPRISPVSIMLVLDISSSMRKKTRHKNVEERKIDTLKKSVKMMFQEIETKVQNPSHVDQAIRTGMIAFSDSVQSQVTMDSGWKKVSRTLDRIKTRKGTDTAPALRQAHRNILRDRSRLSQNNPYYNPQNRKEYVIFMTDGYNPEKKSDRISVNLCNRMKNDNIEVFAIAFSAPKRGRALLKKCASKTDKGTRYFEAINATTFNDAFENIGLEILERGIRIKT